MKKLLVVLFLLVNGLIASAWAAEAFVVKNIEVEGLQRIDEETVDNYLPIRRGEVLRPEKTAAIIRSLYKTGFFDHITLSRSGNTLIIHVVERPIIGQLKISGNNVIPTDKLTSVMKSLDIAEGRVYNKAELDRIKQSLLNQYYELGRYNARIDIIATQMPRNRVFVKIDISEGLTAKIRHITIIGNHAFSEHTLIKQLTITHQGLLTFFTQTDQYSQAKLDESLEGLRGYYLNHGYLKVNVKSSQASITPDRKSVYVTIVVEEGLPYTVKGFTLTGDFVVPRAKLLPLIQIAPGESFSRQKVMDSEKAINDELGKVGYIYSTINLNPTIDDKNRTVFLDFHINAGKRMYVRHIFFADNTKTNDVVLRREMQQMEGSVASTGKLEESKRRLNLLPYLKDTEMSVVPVEGTSDQVDVKYKVTENNSAELSGRVGYSTAQHVILGAGVNQKNFLGTGKTIGLNVETSRYQRFYGASYTDPYFTIDGISRSVNISASRIDPGQANLTKSYTMNEYDLSDTYSIPFGQEENAINRLELGYGYQNTLITFANSPTNVSSIVADFAARHGRHFQQFELMTGLSRDTRDKAIFPTMGQRHAVGLSVFLPIGTSLRYYMMNYAGAWFHPLINNYLITTRGALGYGNAFSNGEDYPFFKNFYAGGIGSVRGFTPNTLGPKDNTPNHNSTGGNFLADASVGIILPNYISDSLRTTVFVDAGNVYQTFDNRKYGGTGSGPIRYSVGVSGEWLSPMGPIEISLARPLNVRRGDDLKAFDFSLGANFG